MNWTATKNKLPGYESYIIVWHNSLKVSRDTFYNGKDKWVNFKTVGSEVEYYEPEQITHWMYWPSQPEELNGK
jgi:hypothetical protein